MLKTSSLGLIEGFFGRQWTWSARAEYAAFLREHGYHFYICAPKGDRNLREEWHEPWPDETYQNLHRLREVYRNAGLKWGIGLNLYELHFHYDDEATRRLEKKIDYLNRLEPDILAVLFDDMQGDCNRMAEIQIDVTHRAIEHSNAELVIMCPTYYSDDPMLDRLFGQRPASYLEDLGKRLDPAVNIFWTGPEVCSKSYTVEHLESVAEKLGRKPFLWDNYPVNDGKEMCKHLYLRPITGRPRQIAELTAGHAVNPMNQAALSKIPLATLAESYREKDSYDPAQAFSSAVAKLCSAELAAALREDLPLFHDEGLDAIAEAQKQELIGKYERLDGLMAAEVAAWLRGEYPYALECLTE